MAIQPEAYWEKNQENFLDVLDRTNLQGDNVFISLRSPFAIIGMLKSDVNIPYGTNSIQLNFNNKELKYPINRLTIPRIVVKDLVSKPSTKDYLINYIKVKDYKEYVAIPPAWRVGLPLMIREYESRYGIDKKINTALEEDFKVVLGNTMGEELEKADKEEPGLTKDAFNKLKSIGNLASAFKLNKEEVVFKDEDVEFSPLGAGQTERPRRESYDSRSGYGYMVTRTSSALQEALDEAGLTERDAVLFLKSRKVRAEMRKQREQFKNRVKSAADRQLLIK